jgi:hypothetical protein
VERQLRLAAQGTSNTAGRQSYREVASTVAEDVMIAVESTAAPGHAPSAVRHNVAELCVSQQRLANLLGSTSEHSKTAAGQLDKPQSTNHYLA